MKLSILIVNWNTRDLVVKCVQSILDSKPNFIYEIVVVDNASSDSSLAALRQKFGNFQNIKLIDAGPRNLGFAAGNNVAYKYSSGEFVLLLNPDTEVSGQGLDKLVNYLEAHNEIGVSGPKIINSDGSLQPSVRRFPDIWSSILVFSSLYRFIRPSKYLMDGFDYEKTQEVDQVMGAALLTRKGLIEELGFLDEKFYLWYEEVDFCKRVKHAGYKIVYYPGATIMHRGGESFAQFDIYKRKKTLAKSLVYYFEKNGKKREAILLKILMPAVLIVAKFLQLFVTLPRPASILKREKG